MNYEWYPGHMTAAIRMMRENLSLIDLVIEMVDARIPLSSRNPDIDGLCQGKARLIVMNKADLSDRNALDAWVAHFKASGLCALPFDSRSQGDRKKLISAINEASAERRERNLRRGIKNQPIRAMVAGIPNVGKSTMINLLAGKGAAKTGNKPGVTRGRQWIQTGKSLQLLDTPGILWPKIGDPEAGELLALIGSMNDSNLDETAMARSLIIRILKLRHDAFAARYGITGPAADADEILKEVALARGCIGEGASVLTDRAAALVVDDFRKGKLGGFLFETPGDRT